MLSDLSQSRKINQTVKISLLPINQHPILLGSIISIIQYHLHSVNSYFIPTKRQKLDQLINMSHFNFISSFESVTILRNSKYEKKRKFRQCGPLQTEAERGDNKSYKSIAGSVGDWYPNLTGDLLESNLIWSGHVIRVKHGRFLAEMITPMILV